MARKRRNTESAADIAAAPESNGFHWDREREEFVGSRDPIRAKVAALGYFDEFGEKWVADTWLAIREWCAINPERIGARKSATKFVLNWYRREAARKRELMR